MTGTGLKSLRFKAHRAGAGPAMPPRTRARNCFGYGLCCGRCAKPKGIIQRGRCTLYTSSSLLMVDGELFSLMLCAFGAHYVEIMLNAIGSGRAQFTKAFPLMGLVCKNISTLVVRADQTCEAMWWTGSLCNGHVRKLQAWWRARLARRLAVAMALHPRLGAASPLGGLTEDVLRLVIRA